MDAAMEAFEETQMESELYAADAVWEKAEESIRDLQLNDRVPGRRETEAVFNNGMRAAAGAFISNTPRPHPEDTAIEGLLAKARASATFYGSVLLDRPVMVPWLEMLVYGLTGRCRLVDTKEHLGIRANGRDASWSIMVAGKVSVICVPGCQVRMIQRHPERVNRPNENIVLVP